MKTSCKDTYFLDRDLAYQTALAHNTVTLEDGRKTQQLCYYDGQPFSHAPDNLVNVPVDQFIHYFNDHHERVPKQIDFTAARRYQDAKNLQQRYHNLIATIQNLSKKNAHR